MKNNNVCLISNSTKVTVVLSLVAMTILSVLIMSGASFANGIDDEFGGPGIGMKDSTWNGTETNRIYGYGNLNGIIGDEIVETNALWSNGPTNYKEYTDDNPIDHSLIDMGPKSANNDAYSLHFIEDNGPGMKIQSNALGKTQVYNDGGPGNMVSALNGTNNTYVDYGPKAIDSTVSPEDYLKFLTMKPGDFTFIGGTREDKLNK